MSDDELLFLSRERKPLPSNWRAPQLNLHAARAVRHEEIRLGRSLTKEEQNALIARLCAQ